ncbi:unnamed protein product [Effrenium voratum]|nr:unnamed protein product [Effrenium voratum]
MLLLRTLESLAEHSLHAPEFVAAVYDRIRFGDSHDEVRVPVDAEFTLKYDLILSGVEALRRNGDPFRGGVNFDEM